MLKLVDTIQTNFSQKELIKTLIETWFNIYNKLPDKENIAIIFSQWSLETGQGKFCWNYNIGNVKAFDRANEVIEYCSLKGVWEIVNGKRIELSVNDPGSWFRSFATLKKGVDFHLDFLMNKRYKNAWGAIVDGDPVDFSRKLRVQGYYTAPEAHYTKALVGYFNVFMKSRNFELAIQEVINDQKPIVLKEIYIESEILPEATTPTESTIKAVGFWAKLIENILSFFKTNP